jgi:hypothetical protein
MKTKIIKIIFFISAFYLFLPISLICQDTIPEHEIETDQELIDPVYDFIMFSLYGYYDRYYKYPTDMDTFVNYLYYGSLNSVAANYGRDINDVKMEMEQLKQKILPISINDMRGLSMSQIAFNYCYVYKNVTQFIYEEGFIALICGADSIYLTYKKPDVCIDRYVDYGSVQIKFYDNKGQIVFIDSELIHTLYKSINDIVKDKYKQIWIDENRAIITAILKYNKKDGLSSFCPDDNVDVEHDSFFIDVKNILDKFVSENDDIYEIIIPVICYESRKE